MPAKNPRVNVVLDPFLYEGVSLSTKVRDLLRESIEIQEDILLADFATEREKSLGQSEPLSHEEVWP